jgi:lysophospholipid acyltransferase (LPLAT)-like uncharacterized protein
MFRDYFLPRIIYYVYRLWALTWRFRNISNPLVDQIIANNEPTIFAHWHRDELAVMRMVTDFKIATMTSTSRDGKLIDYVIRKFGGATSKGSSTRGGSTALLGLTRLVEEGYRASIAVDGPKGPIYQAKPGIFELSRLSKGWIIPAGVGSSSHFVFKKSWNKARLPLPFSKVVVIFGAPTRFEGDDPRSPALSFELGKSLNHYCQLAEEMANGRVPESLPGSSH